MDNQELNSIKAMALNYSDPIRGKLLGLIVELESVQRERDYHIDQNQALEDTVESLQRDKAALIEVLEWFTGSDKWNDDGPEVIFIDGMVPINSARTFLLKMKG